MEVVVGDLQKDEIHGVAKIKTVENPRSQGSKELFFSIMTSFLKGREIMDDLGQILTETEDRDPNPTPEDTAVNPDQDHLQVDLDLDPEAEELGNVVDHILEVDQSQEAGDGEQDLAQVEDPDQHPESRDLILKIVLDHEINDPDPIQKVADH